MPPQFQSHNEQYLSGNSNSRLAIFRKALRPLKVVVSPLARLPEPVRLVAMMSFIVVVVGISSITAFKVIGLRQPIDEALPGASEAKKITSTVSSTVGLSNPTPKTPGGTSRSKDRSIINAPVKPNTVSYTPATTSSGGGTTTTGGSTGGTTTGGGTTSGGGTTTSSGVQAPGAPTSYVLPASYAVANTSNLASVVAGGTRDVVLENGDYNGGALSIGNHRLWSRNLGGATLHFGIKITGDGGEVHGLKLDVNGNGVFDDAVISIPGGAGQNSVVADTWIYGHRTVGAGILNRVTSGFRAQRIIMSGFTGYGVIWQAYYPNYITDNPATKPIITDIDVSAVYRSSRGSSDGTAEAGIWAATGCDCNRIKIRDIGWMGLWTGANANDGTFANFDIDNIHGTVPSSGTPIGAGMYLEHYTRRNVFKNFLIGRSSGSTVREGVICEWADPGATPNPVGGESMAACHGNTFQDGFIYSTYVGFSLEDAEGTTIKRIKFGSQSWAAIKEFRNSGSGYNTVWSGQGNDFSSFAGPYQYTNLHD